MGQEDPLEKGVATQSSTLAWKIPCAEESGGLQSMGSQGVGHDSTRVPRAVTPYFLNTLYFLFWKLKTVTCNLCSLTGVHIWTISVCFAWCSI